MKPEQIFEQYPKLDSFYETSDGAQFFMPQEASAHAGILKDKKVKEVKRPEAKSEANATKDKTANKTK